jgi:2-polyprenyl-3-methyl-5-hydroxy-6-metoxy-1,4-benzoquinol methylase
MSESTGQMEGSATRQSDLWTERARDWAEVIEGWSGWGIPVYRHVLERIVMDRDTRVLDVGCGAGRFSRIAADRGAMISGLDATASFVEIARERVPEGDFRVGEMEDLPWADNSFDVVTGFNSFFIAATW